MHGLWEHILEWDTDCLPDFQGVRSLWARGETVAKERDCVVPSLSGREGESGLGVSNMRWFKEDFNGCLCTAGCDGLLHVKVCTINLDER